MEKIDITNLIPNFILGDRNGWAIAKALEKLYEISHEIIREGIDTAINLDKMPEWRLDEVAQEDNVFWYDFAAPVEAKREILKNAEQVYSTLGTKTGTENAAKDYCGDARIEEWFEYGGEPGYFRVYSRSSAAAQNANELARSVNAVKRLSAVLDGIYIEHPPLTAQIYAGFAVYVGSRATFAMPDANAEILKSSWLTDETDAILMDERGILLFIEEG